MRLLFVITGGPGVGKTILLSKLVERLRATGMTVGGLISYEKRHSGQRVGFEVQDLASGSKAMLATESSGVGPRVGKYVVNLESLAKVAAPAIISALQTADVVAIDEVGPMELFSPEFRRAVEKALDFDKPVVVVVHERSMDPLARRIREHIEAERMVVSYENRDSLLSVLEGKIRFSVNR